MKTVYRLVLIGVRIYPEREPMTGDAASRNAKREKQQPIVLQVTERHFCHQIGEEFIKGSAISKTLFLEIAEFASDQEIENGEVVGEPIAEFLNWKTKETQAGFSSNQTMFALLLRNEDKTPWQAKLNIQFWDDQKGRHGKPYKAPKRKEGEFAPAYLPPLDKQTKEKISDRYGIEIPSGESFWSFVESNPSLPIIITEGGKKSLCALSHGHIAIALYGCDAGSKKINEEPVLIPDLARFCQKGREFIIAFDKDENPETIDRVNRATKRLSWLLRQQGKGIKVKSAEWEASQGKGLDDLVVNHGEEALEDAIAPKAALSQSPATGVRLNHGMTTLQRDAEMIREEVGHLLSFDIATQNFYLEGERLILGRERLLLSTKYGLPIKTGKDDVSEICVQCAQENTYSSVKDYLEGCKSTGLNLLALAGKVFGNQDPLQAVFLKKWLIAAVARAYEPGCQADEVLILQGGQGQGKSSFFAELVPKRDLFNGDGLRGGKINDEEIRKAQRTWLIEIPEIDKIFKKSCSSELKAHMTQRSDWLRQLYERMPENYPRSSIMAGTTNEPEFFTDDTGNRRYLVVQILVSLIDSAWLKANRDAIWAAARDAYKKGEIWYLTPEEKVQHARQNVRWKVEHPWHGAIEKYVRVIEDVTVPEILKNVLHLEMADLKGKSEQMQVAGILKALGFEKTGKRGEFGETKSPLWRRELPEN
ncbi:MAG: VapE domain-containing protein [Microcoleus sp.]